MKTQLNWDTVKPLALASAVALALTVSASAVAQQASAPPLVTVPPGSLQNSSISQTAGADSTLSSQDSGQMQDSSACVGPAGSCGAPPPPAGPSCPVGSIPYGAYPECEVKKDLGCTGGWVGQRIWWVDVFTGTPIALFQNTCAAPSSPPASPPPASPPPASPPPATPPPPPPPSPPPPPPPPASPPPPPAAPPAAASILPGFTLKIGGGGSYCTFSAFTGSYNVSGSACGYGYAKGSFTGAVSYNGSTAPVSIACVTAAAPNQEDCSGQATVNVGGGQVTVTMSGYSTLKSDGSTAYASAIIGVSGP